MLTLEQTTPLSEFEPILDDVNRLLESGCFGERPALVILLRDHYTTLLETARHYRQLANDRLAAHEESLAKWQRTIEELSSRRVERRLSSVEPGD